MPEKELNLGQFALQARLQPPLGIGMRKKMKPKENLIKSICKLSLALAIFWERLQKFYQIIWYNFCLALIIVAIIMRIYSG